MFASRTFTRFGLVAALALPLCSLPACGGSKQEEVHSIPKPGDMPDGGEWTGVFFSSTYGHLHIIKEGSSVSGAWRNAAGDKWGTLHGEVMGNLLKYEWEETTIGMVGPSAKKSGKGFFQYVRGKGDNPNDEIHGEWGLGHEWTGVTWDAVKQRNSKPDPGSVVPDETQKTEGGGWDDERKKKSGDDKKSNDWN